MSKLVDGGKVRYVGVSNFSLEQLKKAQEALLNHEIVSNQMEYSLAVRRIESDLLPYCEENNIAIMAYRPLAHGALSKASGRFKPIVEEVSRKYGSKTPAQIALNWIISKNRTVFPIPRASKPERIIVNVGAVGWSLSDGDIRGLRSALKHDL